MWLTLKLVRAIDVITSAFCTVTKDFAFFPRFGQSKNQYEKRRFHKGGTQWYD